MAETRWEMAIGFPPGSECSRFRVMRGRVTTGREERHGRTPGGPRRPGSMRPNLAILSASAPPGGSASVIRADVSSTETYLRILDGLLALQAGTDLLPYDDLVRDGFVWDGVKNPLAKHLRVRPGDRVFITTERKSRSSAR